MSENELQKNDTLRILKEIERVHSVMNVRFTDVQSTLKEHGQKFVEIDKKFERMEKRFKIEIDGLAHSTTAEFGKVRTELRAIEGRLSNRIEGVENKVNNYNRRMDEIQFDKIKPLDMRVTRIEKKFALAK